MGVTLQTWRGMGYDKDGDGDIDAQDIKLLSKEDALMVLKVGYWDRWRADFIPNQSFAEQLVDWTYCSGKWGVVIPQRILGVEPDGRVGMQTITAVIKQSNEDTFNKIKAARVKFIDDLVKANPSQEKFKKGWLNRINSFVFKP